MTRAIERVESRILADSNVQMDEAGFAALVSFEYDDSSEYVISPKIPNLFN